TFNRVISNLIDNAIEANATEVIVRLQNSKAKNTTIILIKDNGNGIAPEALKKILDGESVSSKENGHGLGLQYAIKTVKTVWNGCFDINSVINVGTSINITLPRVSAPKWFLSELIVNPNNTIVILD